MKKLINFKKSKTAEIEEFEMRVHPDLKAFFGYNLFKAGIIYRSLMESKYLKPFDLAAPDCGILYLLGSGKSYNQLTIGQELGIDKATIVKIIDKLESLKVVKREVDPRDRRAKLVSLTAKGFTYLDKMKIARTNYEEEIFRNFSKEDEKELRRLLPILLETLMTIKNEK